jgi:MOSC domain-containing protein YiiM
MEEFHRTRDELDAALVDVGGSPAEVGRVELIVRRPETGEREVVTSAELDVEDGLVGDNWCRRGTGGSPNLDAQLTLMNVHAVQAVAATRERWPLAGDQLYVDLDLSVENLPPGTQLALGEAVIEVTHEPHTGCAKFTERFGGDAIRWVNQSPGRELRLRGVNTRIVSGGVVRTGDAISRL